MFVTAVMTVLCTAGTAFYVRFLVALCKECKPRSIGYWVRLRLGSSEDTTGTAGAQKTSDSRRLRNGLETGQHSSQTMLRRTNIAWFIVVIAVSVASWAMLGTAVAQKAATPKPQDKLCTRRG